jgi:hypothetical protein
LLGQSLAQGAFARTFRTDDDDFFLHDAASKIRQDAVSFFNFWGVPPKGFAQSRNRGRAATGCAPLRHFVLAAKAATLHIPARQCHSGGPHVEGLWMIRDFSG